MRNHITSAVEKSLQRIQEGFPIECESDFQSVFFGELYNELNTSIVRLEKKLNGDYQSYSETGKTTHKRKSRVDIHIIYNNQPYVIELKFLQGASQATKADMIADIAKVERIIESGEATNGFCVQLIKPGVLKKLPSGAIETGHHRPSISGWDYDFFIKGNYEIAPIGSPDEYTYIIHQIKCT